MLNFDKQAGKRHVGTEVNFGQTFIIFFSFRKNRYVMSTLSFPSDTASISDGFILASQDVLTGRKTPLCASRSLIDSFPFRRSRDFSSFFEFLHPDPGCNGIRGFLSSSLTTNSRSPYYSNSSSESSDPSVLYSKK